MTPSHLPPAGVPPAEIEAGERLVAGLVASQCPDLAGRTLRRVGSGWDNHLFRLGEDLAVRLPRRRVAVDLILKEQRWLPHLAAAIDMPISAPVRSLPASAEFPWPWSVTRWLDGVTAEHLPPAASEAARFGRFLRSLHSVPVPPDAPRNPVRGVALAGRSDSVLARLGRMSGADTGLAISIEQIRKAWLEAVAAPADARDTWIHGDLHPMNVLVNAGRLAGIIDWGDLCAGDPATDLASAWFLFDDADRVISSYGGISPATRERGRGWAILFGVVFLETGLQGHPGYGDLGRLLLRRVLDA